MTLDYLDATDGGIYPEADPNRLIRLCKFTSEEAEQLYRMIESTVVLKGESVDISSQPFVSAENCRLVLKVSTTDFGIDPSPDYNFICNLSIEGYKRMLKHIINFCGSENGPSGYDWLYDPQDGKIDLLFSTGGSW